MRLVPLLLATLLAPSTPALADPPAAAPVPPDAPPLAAPAAAAPETGPQGEVIEQESAELEAIRSVEAATRVGELPSLDARASEVVESIGVGSPLRDRIEAALSRGPAAPPADTAGRIALLPELDHDLARLQAEYDIPIDVNEAVVSYVRFFQHPQVRPHFVKYLGRYHRYVPRYREILREEGVPEDTVYLAMIESGFANYATSRAKAVGPWQFIAPTGRLYGLRQDFWVDERRDPEKAAHAAARFLKELYETTHDWRLAWASYNAGLGTIQHAQARGYPDYWSMQASKGRRILRAETKGYVPKLMAAAIITQHPEAFGFRHEEIEPERWIDYATVTVKDAAPLAMLAQAAGISESDLIDLNPELRRAATPPRAYQLKVPRDSVATFAERWPALEPHAHVAAFDGHVVSRGETLSGIAHQYGVSLDGLLSLNPRVNPRALRPGMELVIPGPGQRALTAPSATSTRTAAPPAAPAAAPARAASPVGPTADARARTWRVKPGDTLSSIAKNAGVGMDELCRMNGIADPQRHTLKVGVELRVANSTRG
jgi:membrane-bound lytic murein transglycosylase D